MGFDVEEYSKKRRNKQTEKTENVGFDVEAYSKSRYAPKVEEEIKSRLSAWLKDSENFLNSYNERYADSNDSYQADASDWLTSISSHKSALDKEAGSIRSIVDQYKDVLGLEWANSINKAIDSYNSVQNNVISNSTKYAEYWSQWENEDAYNRDMSDWLEDDAEVSAEKIASRRELYESNAARIAEIESELKHTGIGLIDDIINETRYITSDGNSDKYKALKKELEALKAENRQYERTQSRLDDYFVPETEEFLQNASYRDYSNPTIDSVEEYWKSLDYSPAMPEDKLGFYNNDYIPILDEIESRRNDAQSRGEDYRTTIPAEYVALYQEGYDGSWDQLKDNEINIYYNLLKTEGKEAAYAFLDAMKPTLNKRATQEIADKVSEAELGSLKQILYNVASVGANILGGAVSFADDASNIIRGNDINPYSSAHRMQNFAQAVRQDTANDINEWTGNASLPYVGTTWGDVYQALMSGADSFVGAYALGGTGYGILMGTGAASSEAKELYEKGASMGQIAAGGILAGAAEMVFEKASIDHFVKMGDTKSIKMFVINALKQGGVEASEEVFTEIANTITDAIVMGSQSDWQGYVDKYISEGKTPSQAAVKALFNDVAPNIINAGIGGFISGGGMGSLGSIGSYAEYQGQVKQHGQSIIDQGGADTLKALALDMAGVKDSTNAKEIGKLASNVDSKASAKNVGRLSAAMGNTVSTQNKTNVQNALTEKGLSKKDAARVAEYLASDDALTAEQQAEVISNKKISEVVKELVSDSKSVINQRKFNLLAARLGYDTKNAKVGSKTTSVGGVALKNEVDVTDKVSKEGKTTKVSTGEVITIDKNNAIAKVDVVDGERVVYFNTDHGVVEATDVTYANKDEGLIYESFADMNPVFANAAIKNYDGSVPVQTYIDGMRDGIILYGAHNFQAVGKDISRNSDFAALSEADQSFALKLGREFAKMNTEKAENDLKTAIKNAAEKAEADGKSSEAVRKKSKVRFAEGAKATTKAQKRVVALAYNLSKAIGIDIVFYDARYTADDHGKGANGYFDPKDNSIHLDLQKAVTDSKTIVFTMSHELVHFIKKWSPAKFKTFADFLMKQYAEHGVSTSTLLANKMAQLGETDADKAYEEMIADACERMLLDSNAVVKLMELRKADLELFEKIKLHVLEILNNIRDAFNGVDPNTEEGKALQKMEDVLGKIHEMFEDAAVDASKNYQAAGTLNTESVSVYEDGTIQLQMKQYEQTGRSTLLSYLMEQYGDNNANDLISTIDSIYNVMAEIKKDTALSVFGNWQDTDVELDANGHPIFTTSINNGDYELNQDFSRVCKKRRQLNFVLNMLAEDPAFEASNLTKDDFVKINKAIKEHGFEIACALCFVDSKRFRQTEWADSFANTWNDILGSMKADSKPLSRFNFATKSVNMADEGIQIDPSKPISYRKWSNGKATETRHYKNLDDLLEKDGNNNVKAIARLLRDNPNLRHEFRGADIIASDGFDSIQRLAPDVRGILDGWGGSSVPKPSSNDAIYDNSILNIDGYNAEKAFAVGGVRMNSFSDFMAHMFFDYAQAFADLSAKKLPMHSYTKELDFARLFGLTGGKVNMSAIAAIRSNATNIDKIKAKADKEAATEYEKSIAGLDISRLADKLGKSESDITYDDVIQNLDDVDYVWADESIDVKSATLLQSGILYDKLTEGQAAYCYELIRNGQIEDAFRVAGEENVNRGYAKHLGIITVGVSKAHILKLLRDPTIRMVIPYHKSGLNPAVAKALNIAFYDDFTKVQNTVVRFKSGKEFGISSDSSEIGGKKLQDFSFYDFFGKTIDGVLYDGKSTAAKYIEWCEKGFYDESVGDYVYYLNGGGHILASELHAKGIEVKPKFYEFASEENYYKLVEDFDCYDTITGEHSAQEAVDLFHDGLPSDYKDVLTKALKAEQKVSDDFRDHLDNKGLRDEIMAIAGKHGYTPSEESKDDGVKKQAKPSKTDPRYLDPRTVTEADVVEMLNDVNKGKYDDGTCVPVRIGTPKMLIYWAKKKRDDVIDDNPIVMNVFKADKALNREGVDEKGRPQKLSVNDMLTAIKKMNDPRYIVYQGENGRYVEVINHVTDDGRSVFSVLEIGDYKDAPYMNGYEGDLYNVFVTAYPPKAGKLLELLNNPKNKVIYDKEKDLSQVTSDSTVSSVLNDKPFYEDIIPQDSDSVKREFSEEVKKQKKNTAVDSRGRKLTEAQEAFFKGSMAVDEMGRLKVLYHGSHRAGFMAFVNTDDIGYFFTDSIKVAKTYSESWKKYAPKAKRGQMPVDPETDKYVSVEIRTIEQAKSEAKRLGFRVGKTPDGTYDLIDPKGKIVLRDFDESNLADVEDELETYQMRGQKKANYTVYLDLKNPLIIDGRGGDWNMVADYGNENLVTYDDLTWEQKKAIARNTGILPSKFKKYLDANDNQLPAYDIKNNTIQPPKKTREWVRQAVEGGYDGVIFKNIVDDAADGSAGQSNVYVALKSEQIKSTANKNPTKNPDIRYQKKTTTSYAPTFYSQMGKVIDDIKMEKIGAASIVNFLKGKGIKNEEIKWSGIEAFLEGKKSVTKAELQEFVAGSMLQIVEEPIGESGTDKKELWDNFRKQMDSVLPWLSHEEIDDMCFDDNGDFSAEKFKDELQAYVDDESISEMQYEEAVEYAEEMEEGLKSGGTRWGQYKLDGGSNYRELVFKLPNSSYSNNAMRVHWGDDAGGILVHARVQDFDVDGKTMLFIEELQSDWHNEGHSKGYSTEEYEEAVATYDDLYNKYQKHDLALSKYIRSNEFMSDPEDVRKKKFDWLRSKVDAAQKKYIEANKVVKELKEKGAGDTPNAPFKDTYHEYVLKRLLRMAAEEGYDSIGWTPSEIQSDRWSDEFAEAYRIEYDQDMPKFLRKYGKRWGATVGKTTVGASEVQYDIDPQTSMDDDSWLLAEGVSFEGTEVWSMDITDSMKESVLHEGQPMYQKKQTTNRELLANALEGVAQNDIEKNKLAQYKSKIDLIESEQAKLAEVKAKANELRFTKGRTPDETKRMRDLDFEANQIANRINTYDRQLLNLESTAALKNVLQREKELARKRAEKQGKEALRKAKEKRDETIRTLMKKNSEARARGIESRSKTEMRRKIRKIVSELNDLLLNGSKDRNVKIGLQKVTADALLAVNMDTVNAEKRLAEIQAKIDRANDPDKIAELKKRYDNIESQGENMKARLDALRDAYSDIRGSKDPLVANAHNAEIEKRIENVRKEVGDTPLREMSLEQLDFVYDTYKIVLTTIRNANKMFKQGKYDNVVQTSEAVNDEVRKVGGVRKLHIPALDAVKGFGWNTMTPMYAFRTIGSDTFSELFEEVRRGEDLWATDIQKAYAYRVAMDKKYGRNSWDLKKTYEFESNTGERFTLNVMEMLSLYAYSRRGEQALNHIKVGGIVKKNNVKEVKKGGITIGYEVDDSDAYNLSDETLGKIFATLTAEQKEYAKEMQRYLSEDCATAGNEVSLELYGVKLFKEDVYFPIKTSSDYREFNPEETGDKKIVNSGFAQGTIKGANNAIVLDFFDSVWATHVDEMAMYHGFALALEDFSKVYNYRTKSAPNMKTMSTKATLKKAYGDGVNNYIKQLLTDINGGARSQQGTAFANKMISLMKKGAVAASLSVAIQQPSAMARAMAYIDPKYFVKSSLESIKLHEHNAAWEEVKKYAPVAIIKEMGRFDTGVSQGTIDWLLTPEYEGLKEKAFAYLKDKKYRKSATDDVIGFLPSLMDELTWVQIWNATKSQVAQQQKLDIDSEECLKAVGDLFTSVITRTQVYDSVLSKSGLMRSKDTAVKMAVSFMAEPTVKLNMLWDAAVQAKRGGKEGVKFCVRVNASILASTVVNAALKAIIYAMRDDDEDETYAEKYMGEFVGGFFEELNPLSLIPYVRDVVSIFQGYDVARTDMTLVSDLATAIKNMDSDTKTTYEKYMGLASSISAFAGIPLKNVERDLRGIYNTVKGFMSGLETTSTGVKESVLENLPFADEASKTDKLYDAIMSGDKAHIERLKSGYKDEQAINTAIRAGLRENDSRIKEAAQARVDGDISEYTRLVREIVAEGNFVQDIVVGAINSEINAINKKADDQDESDDEEDETEKVTSIYRGSDINDAFESGDSDLAVKIIDDLIETKVANGMKEANAKSSVKSSMTEYWKPLYKAAYKAGNTAEMRRIREILSKSGLYGRASDILDTCKAWLREKD